MPRVTTQKEQREDEAPVRWPIFAIILLALAVRLAGVGYLLPYPNSPEEQRIVKTAFKFTAQGIKPRQFDNPVATSYILAGEYGAAFGVAHLLGRFQFVSDYEKFFLKRPSFFYVLARLTSIFFGLLAIYMVYVLGRNIFEWGVGIIAAFLLAVEPHQVQMSLSSTGETMALFLAVVGLYSLSKVEKEGRMGAVLLGAVYMGFAASVAYWYAPLVLAVYLAYFATVPAIYKPSAWIVGLFVAAVCFLFGMLLPCGMLLISPRLFARGVATALFFNASTGDLSAPASAAGYIRALVATNVFSNAVGWGLAGAGLFGIAWGMLFAKWQRVKFFVVFSFLAAAGVFLFPWNGDTFQRWAFVVSVPLAIGAAWIVYRLFWRKGISGKAGLVLIVIFAGLIAAQPAAETGIALARKSGDDTRYRFGKWAEENLPHLSRVLVTPNADVLFRVGELKPGNTWGTWRDEILSAWNGRGFGVTSPSVPVRGGDPPTLSGFDYVVVDSWTTDILVKGGPASRSHIISFLNGLPVKTAWGTGALESLPERSAALLSVFEQAKASGQEVKSIAPAGEGLKGFGPGIEVMKVAPEGSGPSGGQGAPAEGRGGTAPSEAQPRAAGTPPAP